KNIYKLACLLLLLALPALAGAPSSSKDKRVQKSQTLDTDKYINVNNILMMVANNGAFATDQSTVLGKTDGLYFPYVGVDRILDQSHTQTVVYASGLWIGAVDSTTHDTLVDVAEYSREYVPGNIPTVGGSGNPAYRIYKIYRDSLADNPNQDYLNWPVSQG